MKNLHKVSTIRRLSQSFGMKLDGVEFPGNGISFSYLLKDCDEPLVRKYSNADEGIVQEISYLEKLLLTQP